MKKIVLSAALLTLSYVGYGQNTFYGGPNSPCTKEVWEELSEYEGPKEVELVKLKEYPIQMRNFEGVPFSFNTSYVFSKNNSYTLFLNKYEDMGGDLTLRMFDNKDQEVTLTKEQTEMGERYTFWNEVTGIYHLVAYTKQEEAGCVMLGLFFNKSGE